MRQHASDCATHNAPALPVGPCDCNDVTIIPPGGLNVGHVWQPIETAPMDGTEVILFYRWYLDGGFVTAGYYHQGNNSPSFWYADLVNGGASPPTHWMPLPDGPEVAA